MEPAFDISVWTERFKDKLISIFGSRLLFFGLQGSYGRGEQTPESDIDVVVILDAVSFDDLKVYRDMIDDMECSELICGFVSGKAELLNWEKSDLLSLIVDTIPIVGSLDNLRSFISDEDISRAVLSGACNIYHACSHNFLHARSFDALAGLYKMARFTVRIKYLKTTGTYIPSMAVLEEAVSVPDKTIMLIAGNIKNEDDAESFDRLSRVLIEWASGIIKVYGQSIRFLSESKMNLLECSQFEHLVVDGHVLNVGRCDVKLKKWDGATISNTFGGKTLIDNGGKPLFAELAVVDWFMKHGWNARWVCTYGRNRMNPLFLTAWEDCSIKEQKSFPITDDKISSIMISIAQINGNSFSGCWDVIAWKDDSIIFAECKKYKADKIRDTQIKWLKSALKYGLHEDNFRIIQWKVD